MSRLLPRFTETPLHHDPLEIKLAQIEAKRIEAIDALNNGKTPHSDATDKLRLRGIPVQAMGVGSTIVGTDPLLQTIRSMSVRRIRHTPD